MSATETAEAVLLVIKRLFKWAIYLAVLGIGLILLVLAYVSVTDWYERGRHLGKIQVSAGFGGNPCIRPEFPLHIHVVNRSTKTITNMSISVEITKQGFSTRLNNYDSFDSDRILRPGEGWFDCYAPISKDSSYREKYILDGKDMIVKVTHFSPTFE